MPADDSRPPSSQEQAALRELDNLQRAIEESRRRRLRANDAFDSFLKSFNENPASRETAKAMSWQGEAPAHVPSPPRPPDRPAPQFLGAKPLNVPAAEIADPKPLPVSVPPAELVDPKPQPVSAPPGEVVDQTDHGMAAPLPGNLDAGLAKPLVAGVPKVEPWPVPAALTVAGAPRRPRPQVVALAAVAVLALLAFLAWRGQDSDPQPAAPVEAAAKVPAPAPSADAASAATTGSQAPAVALLSTTRRVWVRVTVDGVKMMEQELPADSRVPLEPRSQVVIRAGDAGAVRLAIRGADQGPIGVAGQPATKAFKIEPSDR